MDSGEGKVEKKANPWIQTDLEDCANAFIDLARNTSMTGQKITVDAGLCPI